MLSFKDWLNESEKKELKPKKIFYEVLDQRIVRDALVKRNLSRTTAVEIIRKIEKSFDCTFKHVSTPESVYWWKKTNLQYNEDEIRIGSDIQTRLTFIFSKNIAITIFSGYLLLGIIRVNDREVIYQSYIKLNRMQFLRSSLEKERDILEQCISLSKRISELNRVELLGLSDWLSNRNSYYDKKPTQKQSTDPRRASGTYKFGRLTLYIYEFIEKNSVVIFKINGIGDKELKAIEASLPRIFHEIRGKITGTISGIL